MTILFVTYAIAWGGIGAFAVRLIMKNRRLIRRIEELGHYTGPAPQNTTSVKKSA